MLRMPRLCCFAFLMAYVGLFATIAHGQSSRPCRTLLQQKRYQDAANCFHKLYQTHPKRLGFLRNQAIIYRMWSDHLRPTKPGMACHIRQRAIAIYQRYSTQVTGTNQLEILARIARLKDQLGLASLNLTTLPEGVPLSIQSPWFAQTVTTPHLFTRLCPGKYQVSIQHKDYFSIQKALQLQPGQASTYTLRLQPRKAKPDISACPATISRNFGAKGCLLWERCNANSAQDCAQLAQSYRAYGEALNAISYAIRACELGISEQCYQVGKLSESAGQDAQAIRYLGKACKKRHAAACFLLGEFFARHTPVTKQRNRERECAKAIRAYHRACQYGQKKACSSTCNTVDLYIPVILHGVLHFGGIFAGLTLSFTNFGGDQIPAKLLGWGGLSLLLSALNIPLWVGMFSRHSLGYMILNTALLSLPVIAAAFCIGLGWYDYYDGVTAITHRLPSEFFFFGFSLLMFSLPIQILWNIFGWMSYHRHKSTVAKGEGPFEYQAEADKPSPPTVSWSPILLRDGAGFALFGTF